MYLFYAWLIDTEKYTLVETWPVVLVLYVGCISVAYLCLKLYDIPIRKWLKRMIGQSVSCEEVARPSICHIRSDSPRTVS